MSRKPQFAKWSQDMNQRDFSTENRRPNFFQRILRSGVFK